ncbi:MAG: aminotransferase DegT [Sulfuricurvum sp. PC08-66]|nr:MAG: aminotransferase DegT [Sulfuricurvum sp. PC08-66]
MQIPFFRPTVNSTQRKLVNEVLEAEIDDEKRVTILEEAFVDMTQAPYAVATNNATSAMHLALCALQIKRGDKVLCSVNAFPSVPEVVRHFDAEPVFIDIDRDDFNIDLNALERYLEEHNSKKLKAVIVSHIAGQTTHLERLYKIAQIYDIKIIEDASEAMGATYHGQPIGSTGADVVIFSFSPHLKDTHANGGVMVCHSEEIYERALLLRDHAIPAPNTMDDERLEYIYDVVDIGCKYTMSELDAAFCLGALENIQSSIERHQEIANRYKKRLEGVKHIALPMAHSDEHIYFNYIVKIDKNRDSFARDLKAKGVSTGLHYIPLHLLTYYKNKYELRVNSYPVALQTYQQVLSLPIFEEMTDKEVDYICDTIIELAKHRV